jgi:hypothetical protein
MERSGGVVILDKIPFELDVAKVLKHLRLHGDPARYEKIVADLLENVVPIARPKAVYKVSCVENKSAGSLEIDGIKCTSQLVRDTLEKVETVFPYVGTCGTELDSVRLSDSDVMKRYCLDIIKNLVLFEASGYVRKYLSQEYSVGELSSLNPGEVESFPSSEHRLIFSLLGDVEGMIGVKLTENCALIPTKSGSSLLFSSESKFVSCRLCKMKRCQGRRAPFDAELAKLYPGQKVKSSPA